MVKILLYIDTFHGDIIGCSKKNALHKLMNDAHTVTIQIKKQWILLFRLHFSKIRAPLKFVVIALNNFSISTLTNHQMMQQLHYCNERHFNAPFGDFFWLFFTKKSRIFWVCLEYTVYLDACECIQFIWGIFLSHFTI